MNIPTIRVRYEIEKTTKVQNGNIKNTNIKQRINLTFIELHGPSTEKKILINWFLSFPFPLRLFLSFVTLSLLKRGC